MQKSLIIKSGIQNSNKITKERKMYEEEKANDDADGNGLDVDVFPWKNRGCLCRG